MSDLHVGCPAMLEQFHPTESVAVSSCAESNDFSGVMAAHHLSRGCRRRVIVRSSATCWPRSANTRTSPTGRNVGRNERKRIELVAHDVLPARALMLTSRVAAPSCVTTPLTSDSAATLH